MKKSLGMKSAFYGVMIAAALPVMVQTASAQTNILLTDNFTVDANTNDPNFEIGNGRQGGTNATSLYTVFNGLFGNTADQHQVGNTTTDVGQPGGATNSNYLLLLQGGAYNNIDIAAASNAVGPLTISFDMYAVTGSGGNWGAFSLTSTGETPTPLAGSGEFGFLKQVNGALQVFQNGSITPSGWNAAGFATDPHWTLIFTDSSGVSSAFNGQGSKVTMINGTTTLGTLTLGQLKSADLHPGFIAFSDALVGVDNLSISATPTPSVIPPTFVTDVNPLRSEVTTGAPWTLSVTASGTAPLQYQWFDQNGPISGATSSNYTFNAVAGTTSYHVTVSNAAPSGIVSSTAVVISATNLVTVKNFSFENEVAASGASFTADPSSWTSFNEHSSGDMGSQRAGGVDYTVNNPLAAPADGNQFAYVNVFSGNPTGGLYQDVGALQPNTVYTLTVAIGERADAGPGPGGSWSPGIISLVNGTNNTGTVLATGGGIPGTPNTWQDYSVTFATGGSVSGDLTIMLSVAGASSIQADFDNVRLTNAVSAVPLPSLITNTTPSSATVAAGSNVVFTAAYSNSPPVILQWQQIVSGSPNVTNDINAGVVTITNNGIVSSTLTFNNVQVANAGSYQLKAANATNLVTVVYSQSASLTVIPAITWFSPGAYNASFTDDTVLALAGTVGNEVYGVDFGVGLISTANGYSFDDYASSGNMSIVGSGLGNFSGYLNGDTTGDLNFDTVLNNGVFGTSANTATLNNLTVGQTYTVMVLLDDNRTSGAGGPNFTVTDGITVSPVQRYAFPGGVPKIGGYIMGTFTAQATSQPLTVLQNGNAQYIAVLLEKGIAAPPANAPELTADLRPSVLEVTTGGSVTFTVGASGSLPLHYQWLNQSGPIGGATNASYSFGAVAGTNTYQVIVTNTSGSVASSVVAVISSPNIVTVNNFSFEAQALSPGQTIGEAGPTAWTGFNVGGGGSLQNGWDWGISDPSGSDFAAAADGNNYLWINRWTGNGTQVAGVYQDVGALLPNTTYILTVAIGQRAGTGPNGSWSPGIISLLNGTDNTGTVLAAGGGLPATANTWQDCTASFTTGTTVSGDLTIDLSVLDAGSIQADFDNVRLTKARVFQLAQPSISGGNLILKGSGGTAGAGYTLLTTTNLAIPIVWTTNTTGTFDGTGSFSNSVPINRPAAFFKVRVP